MAPWAPEVIEPPVGRRNRSPASTGTPVVASRLSGDGHIVGESILDQF